MTTEKNIYDKGLQQKIRTLLETEKLDASTIARGINKSPTTLSLYMKSNYNGDVQGLEDDLKKYVEFLEKKEQTDNKFLNFVETTIVKRVFNAANMCQMRGKMGVCYGAPGIGKTTAIFQYKKIGSGVIIVDPYEGSSAKEILKQIADQLNLNYHHNMTLDEFSTNIIKKLQKNKYLIIIDEAENLKVDIFKIIRKIQDRTKNSCGVLFVGTNDLYDLLNKVKYGFPYITSRIGYLEKLDALKAEDVERLVIQYYPKITKELLKFISKTCNYNARAIQNLLDLSFEITTKQNIELSQDVIEAAKDKLLI